MKLYFAPLEGIGSYIYRNEHAAMFEGCDTYYAPFIYHSECEKISAKQLKDILPENNTGVTLMPQILSKEPESFLSFAEKIKTLGYDEVNINAGCPYTMVVKKGRGAGLLNDTEAFDRFLSEIFSRADIRISVKTRAGFTDTNEIERLMEIYNKYPMSTLIIHPRTREQFYNGLPDSEALKKAYDTSKNKLCYNGNIFSVEDYKRITEAFPELDSVMIGRGALANPAIFREIKGGKPLTTAEVVEFTRRIKDSYFEKLQSETFTLHKLKELWTYLIWNYPEEKKLFKRMRKANKLTDYMAAVECLPEIDKQK